MRQPIVTAMGAEKGLENFRDIVADFGGPELGDLHAAFSLDMAKHEQSARFCEGRIAIIVEELLRRARGEG